MTTSFSVSWDYRCPFARNVHEYLVAALQAGGDAAWDVTFQAFSLDQSHVEEGEPAVWDVPDRYPALLANQVGIVVRDRFPDQFLDLHVAMFAARHDRALDTRRKPVLDQVITEVGLDPEPVWAAIEDGWPLETFRKEHEAAVALDAFGVPTFVVGDRATFVRLLDRPQGDAAKATATVSRLVDLLTGWPALNEFKHTQLPR
jgi:predicted DsbA family dithiol-disulfide isomerase